MKLTHLILALVLSLVIVNLAGLNATLYSLRGERIAPVTVPDDAILPSVVNSSAASRSGYNLPESLPRGMYIIAAQSPWEELIGHTRAYPIFLDMTQQYLPNEQFSYGAPVIADFDGDGYDDIFLTLRHESADFICQPQLWMGQPSGIYVDETATRLPALNAPSWTAFPLDLEADEDIDIFILTDERVPACFMLINDGSGHFTIGPGVLFPAGMPLECCVVDIDQDGYPDLVLVDQISYYETGYSVWKNNAGQGFIKDSSGRIPNDQLTMYGHFRIYAHDYNSDGFPELFLCHWPGYPYGPLSGQDIMLLNDGNGYFTIPPINPLPIEDDTRSSFYYFVDTDGDKDDDILRVDLNLDGSPNLTLLIREADSYIASPNLFPGGGYIHNGLVIKDFDLDGDMDLYVPCVQLGETAADWYFSNVGNNSFTLKPQALPDIVDFTVACAPIDHPTNDRPDIFVVNSGASGGEVGLNRLYINDRSSAADDPLAPEISLSAYPNPFRGSTLLKLNGTASARFPLDIYNLRGQKVNTLFPQASDATASMVSWNGRTADGKQLSSGIYFVKIRNCSSGTVARLLLLR